MARFGEALQRSVSRFGAVRVCTRRKAGLRIMTYSGEALQRSLNRFGAVRVCTRRKSKEREGGEIVTIGKLVWQKDSPLESVHWEYDFLTLHPLNHCLDDTDDEEACS
jgi:hypothetical protein